MEAVVDVLGHLRDRDRNLKPRTAQPVVQLQYFGPAAVVALADYRLGRIQEVLYAATFPEEFGVHANAEVDPDSLARSPFQDRNQRVLASTGNHRAPVHDDVPLRLLGQSGSYLLADPLEIRRGKTAVRRRRRTHANKGYVACQHRGDGIPA